MPSVSRRQFAAALGVASATTLVPLAPATAAPTSPSTGSEVLTTMRVPPGRGTEDGPVWSPQATGFAGVSTSDAPDGAIGGLGGDVVVVQDAQALAEAVLRDGPTVVLVEGTVTIEPFGTTLKVSADTSILGVSRGAEIVGGGFHLDRVANVVIRNLTFRDSYVPGDWDGKSDDNDNDGVRVDTSHHVWIDHCEFMRLGDGTVDVRKDSTNVTISWCVFRDHNKTVGVGWTENVLTAITLHHNWFSNTYQRNASIDNVAAGHVYSCVFQGQGQYGTMSRGASQLVVESCLYENGEDAIVAKDPQSRVDSRGNRFTSIRGRKDHTGPTFEPSDHYSYAAEPLDDLIGIVTKHAGPHARRERAARRIRVALDGTGDVASIGAAVGAAWRSAAPAEIVVAPGTYREIVRIWPGAPAGLVLRGETGVAEDVRLTYDLSAGTEKFYGGDFGATGAATLAVLADDVTLRDLTVENGYDEAAHGGSQAQALRTVGDRILLDGVRLLGNQDTFLAETPSKDQAGRVYVTGSFLEGDVDFIYGRATMVLEDCEISSFDRGEENNGYVCAPSTAGGERGLLFVNCRFTSAAAPGTVHLGRPWHPSSDPEVEPAAVVRDSHLGAHIRTPAWSDMGGWPWQDDFLREYGNTGPGAGSGDAEGRPQLTEQEAANHTRETYLLGADDWAPWA
ncbi:pectinesterase family protein [Brachybacterium alimentarium]|uniref:pectinesterase family protein n=1 Tax=Brachybacterium alimentarium TaxID=47845 RepID=UPI003FD07075